MPKELIYGSALPYAEASSARSVIGVHWGKDGNEYLQSSARDVGAGLLCGP